MFVVFVQTHTYIFGISRIHGGRSSVTVKCGHIFATYTATRTRIDIFETTYDVAVKGHLFFEGQGSTRNLWSVHDLRRVSTLLHCRTK